MHCWNLKRRINNSSYFGCWMRKITMCKFIILHCLRHPIRFLYSIVLLMLAIVMLIFHTQRNNVDYVLHYEPQEKIDIGRIITNNMNVEQSPFLQDDSSWLEEHMKKIDDDFFNAKLGQRLKSREAIPMFIVEEHHGVIPYWYSSVETGILPRSSGNTLVHIDAHSDFGNPDFGPEFPLFRWPQRHELMYLMQSNDLFIVSACLTGMFSRVIWVYPDWDDTIQDNSEGIYSPHVIVNVTVGLEIDTHSKTEKSDTGRLCACVKPLNIPVENSTQHSETKVSDKVYCVTIHNSTSTDDSDEIHIDHSQCRLLNRTVRVEIVRESHIVDLIKQKDPSLKLIPPTDSWILDIDEDFFGVESPVLPLYRTNMSDGMIDDLTTWISKNLFAKTARDEQIVDLIFQKIVYFVRFGNESESCRNLKELIHSNKNSDNGNQYPNFYQESYDTELAFQILCSKDILKTKSIMNNTNIPLQLQQNEESPPPTTFFFCPYEFKLELEIRMGTLLSLLYRLNDEQLEALTQVGVCLGSSIPFDDQAFEMKVCDGFNRPNNDSYVTFYTPHSEGMGLEFRARNIMHIIGGLATSSSLSQNTSLSNARKSTSSTVTPPNLITLARSARDGYTPRSMASRIEFLVVRAVRNVFSTKWHWPVTVLYDPDLFGGTRGWNKTRRIIKDLIL